MMMSCRVEYLLPFLLSQWGRCTAAVGYYNHSATGALTGELKKWHKITLGFEGEMTGETSLPNPFRSRRLDVTFSHAATGKQYVVPGYYAATGDAAHTSATDGNVWLAHFSPDEEGVWDWTAGFYKGNWISVDAIANGSPAGYFHEASGSFTVGPTDKTGRDLRGKGRLKYVGVHHMQFSETGEWFFKAGVDSPENFLAYDDFDGTPDFNGYRKSWAPHQRDFKAGDPTWKDDKGTGIIGALNYLSEEGLNSFSMLTMNINGDDRNVYPFVTDIPPYNRMDVSKLAQWEIVFEHADKMGMHMHFKTQEHENDQLLGDEEFLFSRKLYYREIIARFSHHLAVTFNLGEENTNLPVQLQIFAEFFQENDPYQNLVVTHTFTDEKQLVYEPLLGVESFHGASLQCVPQLVFDDTLEWVSRSAAAGNPWVTTNDEQNPAGAGVKPDADDPLHTSIRQDVLYGNLMAGGAGIMYYFGYNFANSDMTCEDFRTRAGVWVQTRHALNFLDESAIPFWTMSSANHLLIDPDTGLTPGTNLGRDHKYWCLATNNNSSTASTMVVYLVRGGTVTLNLSLLGSGACSGDYSIQWYDPRNGGLLQQGTVRFISSSSTSESIGYAPNTQMQDWLVLLQCTPSQ